MIYELKRKHSSRSRQSDSNVIQFARQHRTEMAAAANYVPKKAGEPIRSRKVRVRASTRSCAENIVVHASALKLSSHVLRKQGEGLVFAFRYMHDLASQLGALKRGDSNVHLEYFQLKLLADSDGSNSDYGYLSLLPQDTAPDSDDNEERSYLPYDSTPSLEGIINDFQRLYVDRTKDWVADEILGVCSSLLSLQQESGFFPEVDGKPYKPVIEI